MSRSPFGNGGEVGEVAHTENRIGSGRFDKLVSSADCIGDEHAYNPRYSAEGNRR